MKRTLSFALACLCLLAFLVTESNADCSGRQIGKRIQSGLSKVVCAPKKLKLAIQEKVQSRNCSASATSCSGASSCSAPVMGCSAPQFVPEAVVVPVAVPVFGSDAKEMDCSSGTCTLVESAKSFRPIRNSIAQHKAEVQASQGRMRHIGGSFSAGRFEGVGFSTVSADAAVQQCCYWGQKTPVEIGVARGADGWYATVLYR